MPKTVSIKEAFEQAQKPHQNHGKLVTSLKNRYDKLQDKIHFHEEFVHYLKYALIVYKREPAVEQVINFVAKFVVCFYKPEKDAAEDEPEDEEENSLLNYLFHFLLENHNANSKGVRFRVCQLLNKLLGSLPENAQVEDELFDKINSAMLVRVKDRVPNVRIQAVLALSRLQDPTDGDCPVVNVYSSMIENDSNSEVRCAVLSCIRPSAKTLSKIIGRTMDVKERVRKVAYQLLAEKFHMKVLTIAQRVKLLQQGLNDRSDSVKDVVQKQLLQAWLHLAEGNALELLHRLDVESCPEVGVSALNAIFSLSQCNDLIKKIPDLSDGKVIPIEKLNAENALFWRALCEYLKSKGEEGEEFLEHLLPEPAIYADYLLSYLQNIPVLSQEEKEDLTCIEHLMTKEFIGRQLILMIGCMETGEEGGRKRLLTVLQEILMIPTTSAFLVPPVMEKLLGILKDDDRRIQIIASTISEVRDAFVTSSKPLDATTIRKRQLKLAEIKVKLMEAKDALEQCVAVQDFSQASLLKQKVLELEGTKSDLLREADELQAKEICVEKDDPETLVKCLTICNELLKQLSLSKGLGPTMEGITESLIIPGIMNIHPAVRNMAVLCLGCCGLQSKDFASRHLPILLQVLQTDEMKVKLSALKAIFDQLMMFGMEPFKTKKGSDSYSGKEDGENGLPDVELTKEAEEEETVTTHNLLQLLSGFLDNECPELRTQSAEGLAKLMFSGRLISAKLLSRLVLLWYNPITEEDIHLRHCLGVFFPSFAYSNRANQECFEDAYLPTLQILFNAPASSPLSEVDTRNVSELLVDLTRPSGLKQHSKSSQDFQGSTVHDSLAVKICNEILADPSAPDVRIYTKALSSLELNRDFSKDLLILLDEVLEVVKDKTCLKVIEKMKSSLNEGSHVGGEGSEIAQEAAWPPVTPGAQQESKETSPHPDDPDEEGKKQMAQATEEGGSKSFKSRSPRRKVLRKAMVEAKSVPRRNCRSSRSEAESRETSERPVPLASSRPSRRAKTAALEKTRLNLSKLLD